MLVLNEFVYVALCSELTGGKCSQYLNGSFYNICILSLSCIAIHPNIYIYA